MILDEYYKQGAVAKMYFKLKSGEELDNETARNRWRMIRNPDKAILNKVFDAIYKEQNKMLTQTTS